MPAPSNQSGNARLPTSLARPIPPTMPKTSSTRIWTIFIAASLGLLGLLLLPAADDGFNRTVVISQVVLWLGVTLICGLGLRLYLKAGA